MKAITLKNFKSYDNQLIPDLSPNINLFIGQNGQGKSNFFKAIIFALTDKIHLNRSEYNSHLHRAMDNVPQPIIVELYIRSKSAQQSTDINLYKIERIWHSDSSEELRVEEKPFSSSQYESFIESLGFSYSNPFNILQQGKINQVTLMDEFQIYKLLEDATSIKKFDRKHQEALGYMIKNQEQKKEIKEWLKEIEVRMELYQARKQEFDMYNFEEKASKVRNKSQYEHLIRKFTKEMKMIEEKEAETSERINKMKIKIKDLQKDLEEVDSQISVNQKQIYEHFDDSTIDDLDMTANLTQEERKITSKLKQLKPRKDKLKKQFEKVSKETEQLTTQLKPYKEKYEYLSSLLTAQKLSKQSKGKDDLKTEIKRKRQILQQIESELKKVGKLKSEFKIQSAQKEIKELTVKKQKLDKVINSLKLNKVEYFVANRQKNKYQSEVEVYQQQIEVNYGKMRKVLPLLQFNLINEIRKEKITGVFGFFIQFVDIDPSVLFAYEMAGLNKMCTLLVENESACENVINVNKRIKGKQINIMPLSFVDSRPAIDKSKSISHSDCFSLYNQDWIKIRPHEFGDKFTQCLKKIIVNTFSNHVLVKDYQLGLKISKQHFMNCITADKEVVYSEGYLCKVGKDTNVDDKLELYYKYAEKNDQLQSTKKKLQKISKEVNKFQNREMELSKDKVITESEVRNLELTISIATEQKKSLARLQTEEKLLSQKKEKCQTEIKTKQQILGNFDKRNNIPVNMKQYTEVKEQYEGKLKIYNKNIQLENELQSQLQKLMKEQEQINEHFHNISTELSFAKDHNVSFVGGKQYRDQLENRAKELEFRRKKIEEMIRDEEERVANIQVQNYNQLGNLSILEEQIQFYSEKLQEIGQLDTTMEQINEQSNSFSMSISRMEDRKKVRIFTAFEKLNFGKLQVWNQKYQESKNKLRELQQIEKDVNDMIVKFQREKDHSINQIFLTFQKHFEHIFSIITLHGKTDVRLKKVNEKHRGITKVRNSISIMVSFDSAREATKKWHQFSGGQKTVIAVCMLMALQKCEPAPLYILDEIDAALDSVYLDRIVRLISQQSQHSQYFITSFKRGMLSFPEEYCNYYLVENHNRVSSIRRLGQSQAQSSLDRIVQA